MITTLPYKVFDGVLLFRDVLNFIPSFHTEQLAITMPKRKMSICA